MTTITARRARLYESIRTAHLERARELAPAAIVYRVRRYDFDPSLAEGLELVQAGPLRAARILRRSRLDAVEINEPLMVSSVLASALAVAAVRFGRRRRPRIVTYAIGNVDPFEGVAPTLKRRVRRAGERMLARFVWRRIDAIAYGTEGARDVYRAVLPRRRGLDETLIPALPARVEVPAADRSGRVVFLGAFVPRKGIRVLCEAWPAVVAERPGARLRLVGKGSLLDEIERFAASHPSVELIVDPPRDRIREVLRESAVLVLPSQPSPTWREQVGLPIVEGLEQGCAIVTTTETGLAPWLAEHGHDVVTDAADPAELAAAIVRAVDRGDRSSEIASTLPAEDGRLAADAWMFRDRG